MKADNVFFQQNDNSLAEKMFVLCLSCASRSRECDGFIFATSLHHTHLFVLVIFGSFWFISFRRFLERGRGGETFVSDDRWKQYSWNSSARTRAVHDYKKTQCPRFGTNVLILFEIKRVKFWSNKTSQNIPFVWQFKHANHLCSEYVRTMGGTWGGCRLRNRLLSKCWWSKRTAIKIHLGEWHLEENHKTMN